METIFNPIAFTDEELLFFGRRTQTLVNKHGYETIFNGKLCVIGQNLLISTALQIKGDGCA